MIQNKYKILIVADEANIRKKLGDKPGEPNYIANELSIGYRLNET